MRAIVTTRNGDVDVLKVETRPDPVPGKGEVLIRVKAAGLNFADILARQGLYPDAPPLKVPGASIYIEARDPSAILIRKNGTPIAYAPGVEIR